jgi:hypothetical protein
MKLLRGAVSLLFIVVFLLPAGQARAESWPQPVIDRLQVDIWPEFDRPEVLVIYHITLASEVSLPAKLSLRLPKSSGGPANLAMKDTDGLLYNLDYTSTTPQGDWMVVTFMAPSVEVQLEYYDSSLKRSGIQRTYQFTWPGDYTVSSLTVTVQQPTNASNMKTTPNMGAGRLASDGFYYYTSVLGEDKAGTQLILQLSYDKTDNALSSTSQPVQPVLPVTASTNGRISLQGMMPWIFGVLGVVMVGSAAIWFWQVYRMKNGSAHRRHSHAAAAIRNGKTAIYCHLCGREAGPVDIYCRSCGTRLRLT